MARRTSASGPSRVTWWPRLVLHPQAAADDGQVLAVLAEESLGQGIVLKGELVGGHEVRFGRGRIYPLVGLVPITWPLDAALPGPVVKVQQDDLLPGAQERGVRRRWGC